ncbi:putative ATP-dependent RNA helicase DDX41 [Theileria parva strain Muguga]|uniref:putative ATP-dependent RNA helicase DDX41 n=1 Tax=Theileria parva strain Muguga TaxID=333668 RepID=UPI001C61E13D|nr:putative ATP-dependent RNA helicase DDX41 [Theileria parva strain Muguga]EAN32599.2 putative ATP-dependent RNA helicase DDX41 [Theileria parva strain Muguga]
MQEQESSDNQNLLISDEKQFSLEYIPFKKRKLFVHKHTLRENEASNTNGKNWTKNLDFTPISESKETEKYSGEESEEEKGSKRGGTEGGGRGRGGARDYTYSINVLSLVNDQAKHENMQIKENNLIGSVTGSINSALSPVKDSPKAIVYKSPIDSIYKIPSKYLTIDPNVVDSVRNALVIDVSGDQVPPPILTFEDMKLPRPILKALRHKKIFEPTKIQMQAMPAVLLGRDVIGISPTGTGKTLVFVIPMIMQSWEIELRLPIEPREGPFGLVICPSRELASQIYDITKYFAEYISKYDRPKLYCACVIGGTGIKDQEHSIKSGVHMVIATPGRLNYFLNSRIINLTQCRYLCFDEADRIIDLGFDSEIKSIFSHVNNQHQTLLFSATIPSKIQEFAKLTLTNPIVVNVGVSGSANKNVKQVVVAVPKESKLPMLLQCLKKTPPPVLIFCENKADVEIINEYLILKGVEASAIHGGLSQEERIESISDFKNHKKDVLIGTDIASKGLDFPSIQHVINFDLPRDMENYVHRIGRTGRRGEKGLATTLLDGSEDASSLINLKCILIESEEEMPECLKNIHVSEDALNINC